MIGFVLDFQSFNYKKKTSFQRIIIFGGSLFSAIRNDAREHFLFYNKGLLSGSLSNFQTSKKFKNETVTIVDNFIFKLFRGLKI